MHKSVGMLREESGQCGPVGKQPLGCSDCSTNEIMAMMTLRYGPVSDDTDLHMKSDWRAVKRRG